MNIIEEGEDVVGDIIHSKIENKTKTKKFKFFIETFIFIISIIGAITNSLNYPIAFVFWLISNIISLIYFFKLKSYPLCLQQIFFLITTLIGIYDRFF